MPSARRIRMHTTRRSTGRTGDRRDRRCIGSAGTLPRTVIAISSDHGEAFLGARPGRARVRSVSGSRRSSLRDHPPLILDRGIRVEETIANVDVWPTLLDLVGLPPLRGVDGKSMLPLVLAAGGASARARTRRSDETRGLSSRSALGRPRRTAGMGVADRRRLAPGSCKSITLTRSSSTTRAPIPGRRRIAPRKAFQSCSRCSSGSIAT